MEFAKAFMLWSTAVNIGLLLILCLHFTFDDWERNNKYVCSSERLYVVISEKDGYNILENTGKNCMIQEER